MAEVYFTFLYDTLVSINSSYSRELEEILTMKYGKPLCKTIKIPHKFTRTINGAVLTLIDEYYSSSWSKGSVECGYFIYKYYSGSIEANYTSNFKLEDVKAMKVINTEN